MTREARGVIARTINRTHKVGAGELLSAPAAAKRRRRTAATLPRRSSSSSSCCAGGGGGGGAVVIGLPRGLVSKSVQASFALTDPGWGRVTAPPDRRRIRVATAAAAAAAVALMRRG